MGDMVTTSGDRLRVVVAVQSGGTRPTRYRLSPLPGVRGPVSHAGSVTLVRTAELQEAYASIAVAERRCVQGRSDMAAHCLARAHAYITAARERGDDGPGELVTAARILNDTRAALGLAPSSASTPKEN